MLRISDYVMPGFAEYIKQHRQEHGLTMKRMASRIGVSLMAYREWERGGKPNAKTISRAYAYYGNDVIRLADDPGDSENTRIRKAWLRTGLSSYEAASKINFGRDSIIDWSADRHKIRHDNFVYAMKALREIENENRKNRG